jgi:hypothetical protein
MTRIVSLIFRKGALISSVVAIAATNVFAAPQILAFDVSGTLDFTNAIVPGVSTLETVATLNGGWMPLQSVYSTNSGGSIPVPAKDASNRFFRIASTDISPTPAGFTNFIHCYGLLETVAGTGVGRTDNTSYWQNSFESGPATNAALSRPHYAMADRAGNIYIVDKNSHSVLRVDTNGLIHSIAGTHVGGFNGDGPDAATNLQLNAPNALWVRADGTVYVLDTGNARVRRIATNGIMTTMFLAQTSGTNLDGGRCLWVKDDESLAYFGNTTRIRKWTLPAGVQTLSSGYVELGTFCVLSSGNLIVADRGANQVYGVTAAGSQTFIAGNGSSNAAVDGASALSTAFFGARGVWPVPTGGYLLLLHDGAQLWYIDTANTAHLMINGTGGNVFVHAGDGGFFYAPGQAFIGEGRSVTMDYAGNIIICESDYGFIRRIRFQRLQP